jgi:hypothetical protein
MLETAVGNGTEKFGLQQEITETGRVDTSIRTPTNTKNTKNE